MIVYTYDVAAFGGGKVDSGKLHREVVKSAIGPNLIEVVVSGGTWQTNPVTYEGGWFTSGSCECRFDASLSAPETTTLDSLVAAHVADEPLPVEAPGLWLDRRFCCCKSKSVRAALAESFDDPVVLAALRTALGLR